MNSPFILLVEDSTDDVALILRAMASVIAPEQIVVCGDGVAALDFLHCRGEHAGRNPADVPRLILLDVNLPRLPGLDVLREIRANENTRLLPVTMLSASSRPEDVRAAVQLGANSFVRKPAAFDELGERIALIARYWVELNIAPPATGPTE